MNLFRTDMSGVTLPKASVQDEAQRAFALFRVERNGSAGRWNSPTRSTRRNGRRQIRTSTLWSEGQSLHHPRVHTQAYSSRRCLMRRSKTWHGHWPLAY